MRVATWNINSIRLRINLVKKFIKNWSPDVICFQETKTQDETFPKEALQELGYPYLSIRGMKSYNGVAILSRIPFKIISSPLWCKKEDCRHLAIQLHNNLEIHNFYVPAGGDIPDPIQSPKFAHKLQFVDEMTDFFTKQKKSTNKMILVGDLNIAPLATDVWSHTQLMNVVSHTAIEIEKLNKLKKTLNWVDTLRHFVPADQKLYSWWSYRAQDWLKSNRGRRLDHIWVTPNLSSFLNKGDILKEIRGWDTPSDHVPVLVDLKI
ncbi:MAG: exodeoxyribonuclease III [Alphaproteobacteria bacterium]|nr:exodeoxyribonuclease III [Alphaproteobacteria bacterium]